MKEEEDWTEHREQWTDLTQARASEVAFGGGWSTAPFLGPLPVSLARIWQVKTAVSAIPPPENTFARIGGFHFHGLVAPSHQLKIHHCLDGLQPPHDMS
jgi:hypothetical protein